MKQPLSIPSTVISPWMWLWSINDIQVSYINRRWETNLQDSKSEFALVKPHIRKNTIGTNLSFHFTHMTKHCKYETTAVNPKHRNITLKASLVNKRHSSRYSIGRLEPNLQHSKSEFSCLTSYTSMYNRCQPIISLTWLSIVNMK